jgi:hypothetical protein
MAKDGARAWAPEAMGARLAQTDPSTGAATFRVAAEGTDGPQGGGASHVPVPDQHWPLTQAPVQAESLTHVFRVQPVAGARHAKFVGQLAALQDFGTQWPLSMLQVSRPAGVEVQS